MKLVKLVFSRIAFAFSQWTIISSLVWLEAEGSVAPFASNLAIATIIAAFWSLGLRNAAATDGEFEYEDREYICNGVVLLIFGGVIASIFVFSYGIASGHPVKVLLICLVLKAVDYLFENLYGVLQRRRLEVKIARSLFLRSVSYPLVFVVTFSLFRNLSTSLFFLLIFSLTFLILEILLYFKVRLSRDCTAVGWGLPSFYEILSFFKVHRSLAFALIIGTAAASAPRLFAPLIDKPREAAGFVLFYMSFQAVHMLCISVLQYPLPEWSREYQRGKFEGLRAPLSLAVLLAVFSSSLLVVICIFFGESLLNVLYGESFGALTQYCAILSVGWGIKFVSTVLFFAVRATRTFHYQLLIDVIGLVSVVLFFGCVALVYSSVLSFCLAFIGSQVVVLIATIAVLRKIASGA